MDGHEHEKLSDKTLEREIEVALGVDPSPEFLPRIRARIASERETEGWTWSVPWRWAGAGAAVVAVAIIGLWVSGNSVPAPREAEIVNAPQGAGPRRQDSGLGLRAAKPDSSETSVPVQLPIAREARVSRPPVVSPVKVVISQDEAIALRQLFAAISSRRLETTVLPDFAAALKPPDPIEDIVVEPITISPLAPLEGE
jgi:hypothetical protein